MAKSLIPLESVAENNIVCLSFGIYDKIALNASTKPNSSIASASSITNIYRLSALKSAVSSKCYNNLPGVHIKIFI